MRMRREDAERCGDSGAVRAMIDDDGSSSSFLVILVGGSLQ